MSERINETEHIDESDSTTSGWNSLFDIPFRDAETQEFDRAELEQQTFDKLNKNRSAKKTFQRIILGVAVAAALIGGVAGVFNNSEQGGTSRPVRIEEVIEAADAFVDKDSDDLVWFEEITDNAGRSVEYNQYLRDKGQSYDKVLQGDITQVEMGWWDGRGPMYRTTDQDADGEWDVVHKFDVDTEVLSTIDLSEMDDVGAGSFTMSGVEQLFG